MTRGNQREKAREKNLKKQQKGPAKKDDKNKSTSLELRKERDAEIMRQKQLKKAAEGGACGGK